MDTSERTPRDEASLWDSFLHILMFLSLYGTSIALGKLLHFFIDYSMDPALDSYGSGVSRSYFLFFSLSDSVFVRIYVSILIVMAPLFFYLFLEVTRRTVKYPELRHLRMRKLNIYATLVVTFIMTMGKIIQLLYNVLGGGVSVNSFLHFLVTTIISGGIFAYYLNQVREDRTLAK